MTSGIHADNIKLCETNWAGGVEGSVGVDTEAEVLGELSIWRSRPTTYFHHVGLRRDDLD